MRARLVLGVCAGWTLAALLWGAQTVLGSNISGAAQRTTFGQAIPAALLQMLPWIPATLAVVALAVRFPLRRDSWRRHLPVHLVAAPLVSFATNVLVVLGFWAMRGIFRGVGTLLRQGLVWGTVNLHIALLVYAAVVALTQFVMHYRASRERELRLARVEGQLARAQAQALNAQIRPHFLFNTLHTIGQMWRSGRSDEADAVLDRLGSLFHKVQRSTARTEVPLAEELELVREYLEIEQARFRDRLRCTVRAPDEALGCMVPPLILQPLVENAIRHGVSAVSTARTVEVSAALRNGHLSLAVRDDGPGMRARPAQPGSGTGLRNTRERLAQLYGGASAMVVEDAAAGGTVVRLDIPARRGGEDGAGAADGTDLIDVGAD